jgi:hypothetical protein
MIYQVTMYAGKCDHCGRDMKFSGGEYSALCEASSVEEEMGNSDWEIVDGKNGEVDKHYCIDCYYHDDEDNFCLNPKPTPNEQD